MAIEASRHFSHDYITEGETDQISAFIMDLSLSDQFNPLIFDEAIQKTGLEMFARISTERRYSAKFVVIGEKMIVFSAWEEHAEGLEKIKREFLETDLSGKLQCAGTIDVVFENGGFGHDKVKRAIYGDSTSLISPENGGLDTYNSAKFKFTVLKEKLGKYFEIQ